MAAKTSWHRCPTKLCYCHSMHRMHLLCMLLSDVLLTLTAARPLLLSSLAVADPLFCGHTHWSLKHDYIKCDCALNTRKQRQFSSFSSWFCITSNCNFFCSLRIQNGHNIGRKWALMLYTACRRFFVKKATWIFGFLASEIKRVGPIT